jgi:hypothetical protein
MTPKACRNCGAPHNRTQPYCPDCEFMTPAEAYQRLHCSKVTWHRVYVNSPRNPNGPIHQRKVGVRKRLVLRAEVDALLG